MKFSAVMQDALPAVLNLSWRVLRSGSDLYLGVYSMIKRFFALLACVFICCIGYEAPAQNSVARDAIDVSMVQLIATPERFDGKRVRVIGYAHLEFEGNTIYLHSEDYRAGLPKNAMWLDVTDTMRKNTKQINNHYVLVEAIFDAKSRGHMGLFGGELRNINRWSLWK